MSAINRLLNPAPDVVARMSLPSPCSTVRDLSLSPQNHKKQKVAKDNAVFIRDTLRGECRYPPYEKRNEILAAYQKKHDILPMGRIAEFPRHIPYNSEKKSFLEKTGRAGFEVFQYEFAVPGHLKPYVMIWDYNNGLVRTTPLFKSNGYSKTTPSKMLNRNPGLRDICHSITGGSLVAQGYWMPFEAARAIAANFCWDIRYALTPIFGPEFPAMCTPPSSERFSDMVIDPAITQRCIEQAEVYRSMETSDSSRASSMTPTFATVPRHIKQLRPRSILPADSGSDYSTDSSYEAYPRTGSRPARVGGTSYRNTWTSANIPRSVPDSRLPSPHDILAGSIPSPTDTLHHRCETLTPSSTTSTFHPLLHSTTSTCSSDEVDDMDMDVDMDPNVDEDYDGCSDESSSEESVEEDRQRHHPSTIVQRKRAAAAAAAATGTVLSSPTVLTDEEAASILMSLSRADGSMNQVKRRRASA